MKIEHLALIAAGILSSLLLWFLDSHKITINGFSVEIEQVDESQLFKK